jgi:hypothetical protein
MAVCTGLEDRGVPLARQADIRGDRRSQTVGDGWLGLACSIDSSSWLHRLQTLIFAFSMSPGMDRPDLKLAKTS